MDWQTLLAEIGTLMAIIGGLWRLFEARIQTVKTELLEKVEAINKVNAVVQQSLKEDIAELKGILNSQNQLLIQLIAQVNRQDGKTSGTHY